MWTKSSLVHAGAGSGLSQLGTQVGKWVRPTVEEALGDFWVVGGPHEGELCLS